MKNRVLALRLEILFRGPEFEELDALDVDVVALGYRSQIVGRFGESDIEHLLAVPQAFRHELKS